MSYGNVYSFSDVAKRKQPTNLCFLCSLFRCLSSNILIYFRRKWDSLKKSRYFLSIEAMCVPDYCHFVTLSGKLGGGLFLEEMYNLPDLMFN